MEISTLFLQRYDPLVRVYLAGYWTHVSHDQMRIRPHARLNSIAWNLWHITRCEDAGVNRFVADRPQVLDEGGWMEKMNLPWRHHGSEMSLAEVDALNQRVNLSALQEYSRAVQARTREIIHTLDARILDQVMEEQTLRHILVDEGLAHSQAEGFIQNYLGWSKGKCLFSFGLTHSYLHVGEMEAIAGLLEIDFG